MTGPIPAEGAAHTHTRGDVGPLEALRRPEVRQLEGPLAHLPGGEEGAGAHRSLGGGEHPCCHPHLQALIMKYTDRKPQPPPLSPFQRPPTSQLATTLPRPFTSLRRAHRWCGFGHPWPVVLQLDVVVAADPRDDPSGPEGG